MSKKTYPLMISLLVALAAPVLADDTPSAQPIKSPKQKMHECMAKERANNSGMSREDMKKACSEKLQSEDNHPSRPQPSADPARP